MRFAILSINYAPEPTGFAPHATALAQHLAERGHAVDVFTGFPFAPRWRRYDDYRGQLFATERRGSLTVHRLTHFVPRRPSSVFQRTTMEGSFAAAVLMTVLPRLLGRRRRPDVVLYIGAQPAVAMAARVIAAAAGCPYFVNINDLASQAAADVGLVSGRLQRFLERFEFSAYRGAAGASVLCQSFVRALGEQGFPEERIKVIRSPIDIDKVRPIARDGSFRRTHGIPENAVVILHAGSMGRKQGLMNVIDAATLTRDANICWVLVGDGETRSELENAVRKRELESSVRFLPFQSEAGMAAMFAAADLLLLNQVSAVKDAVIPSKLLTYMAAGRPVLAAVNASSQGAEILTDADGGWLVLPEDARRLAAMARRAAATDMPTREAIGARNRAYAEAHFDQRKIVEAHERFMCAAVNSGIAERTAHSL